MGYAAFTMLRDDKSGGGFEVISERVATADTMRASLEGQTWDLIISDYSIPGFGGAAALALYQHQALDIPLMMVSGVMGEALAVEMVKAGAHDYLMKEFPFTPFVSTCVNDTQNRPLFDPF